MMPSDTHSPIRTLALEGGKCQMQRLAGIVMMISLLVIAGFLYPVSGVHRTIDPLASSQKNVAKPVGGLETGKGPNLLAYAQDFSTKIWTVEGLSFEANAADSPDGQKDATRVSEADSKGFHRFVIAVQGVTAPGMHTLSIFVKPQGRTKISFEMTEAQGGKYGVTYFDLENGEVISERGDIEDAGMEELPDGWFRCWAAMPFASAAPAFDIALVDDRGAGQYDGKPGQGVLVWGPQFENSDHATSYSQY